MRSANQESSSACITVPLIAEEKQFPGCCVRLPCYNWPQQTPLLVPTQPWVSLSPGAHRQLEKLQLLSGQVSAHALTAQSKHELARQCSITVQAKGTLFLMCSKVTRQLSFKTYHNQNPHISSAVNAEWLLHLYTGSPGKPLIFLSVACNTEQIFAPVLLTGIFSTRIGLAHCNRQPRALNPVLPSRYRSGGTVHSILPGRFSMLG